MPADSYKVKPGEWINYTAYYGATKNRIVLYLTGGVTDKDSNDVPYVVQELSLIHIYAAVTPNATPSLTEKHMSTLRRSCAPTTAMQS